MEVLSLESWDWQLAGQRHFYDIIVELQARSASE
jgi:hypothetical protein